MVSFSKVDKELKEEQLELIHIDVWGPSTIASLRGSNYYVTFIDGSIRKVWIYFLKNKFDVFDVFKKWKVIIENETNLKVNCLKSNNKGEYIDDDFKRYCAKNEIKMTKIIPEKPQQNGVIEMMNKTLKSV